MVPQYGQYGLKYVSTVNLKIISNASPCIVWAVLIGQSLDLSLVVCCILAWMLHMGTMFLQWSKLPPGHHTQKYTDPVQKIYICTSKVCLWVVRKARIFCLDRFQQIKLLVVLNVQDTDGFQPLWYGFLLLFWAYGTALLFMMHAILIIIIKWTHQSLYHVNSITSHNTRVSIHINLLFLFSLFQQRIYCDDCAWSANTSAEIILVTYRIQAIFQSWSRQVYLLQVLHLF